MYNACNVVLELWESAKEDLPTTDQTKYHCVQHTINAYHILFSKLNNTNRKKIRRTVTF